MGDDVVELALEILAHLEHDELSVAAALDRIEDVTDDPHLQSEILHRAEEAEVIERRDDVIVPTSTARVDFDRDVVAKDGEFSCRRCSSGLSTGYFIVFDAAEHGPFGSTCIRKVTGRE